MTELDTLHATLETIPLSELAEPNMPMAEVLQEANDLRHQLDVEDTWMRLLAVGADSTALAGLPTAVAAARQAQSQWVVIRDRGKAQAQREREQVGMSLRSELVAACRWNLRGDGPAQAVLDAIMQGDGVADLVQDLWDLAMLLDRHGPAFESDDTFDAGEMAEAAHGAAEEITAGLSDSRMAGDHEAAKILRDRAYTHLARIVADLREAGRYAFRREPQRAAVFGSAYRRRTQSRARRRAQTMSDVSAAAAEVASASA